jgi:hypothetical protein
MAMGDNGMLLEALGAPLTEVVPAAAPETAGAEGEVIGLGKKKKKKKKKAVDDAGLASAGDESSQLMALDAALEGAVPAAAREAAEAEIEVSGVGKKKKKKKNQGLEMGKEVSEVLGGSIF